MKLEGRKLNTEQAASWDAVRNWAERYAPLPTEYEAGPGDREAVLAELASRRSGPSTWGVVSTAFARSVDAEIDA
jgi:hypothetical protein